MTNSFVDHCLQVLRREDVRDEVKAFFRPIIDLVLQEIYPYIYLSVLFVVISFLLMLSIFVILVRKKGNILSSS
tara:strand:- start:61 stop:282 length:222 start_codon:yes stop_codon:yes gene_type:complete